MAGGQGTLLGTLRNLLVVLLGLSSGVTALQAGATVVVAAGAAGLGLVVGAVVITVALPAPDSGPADSRTQWEE